MTEIKNNLFGIKWSTGVDMPLNKTQTQTQTEIMKNPEELKNNNKIEEILDTTKIIKSQRQLKNLKRILTSSTFGENTTQRVTKCNNKLFKICNIIIEGKSYTIKNPETKFKINSLHKWM